MLGSGAVAYLAGASGLAIVSWLICAASFVTLCCLALKLAEQKNEPRFRRILERISELSLKLLLVCVAIIVALWVLMVAYVLLVGYLRVPIVPTQP